MKQKIKHKYTCQQKEKKRDIKPMGKFMLNTYFRAQVREYIEQIAIPQ